MRKLNIIATVVYLILGVAAYAEQPQMGTPAFDGTGCKPNTAAAVLSPDGTSLSLIFDEYQAKAGNGVRDERKFCNIVLPFNIPAGHTLSILQADYRGFHSLPVKAVTEFKTSYQFDAAHPHPGRTQKYRGVLSGEFIDTDFVRLSSRCGGAAQLTIRTELVVKTNDHGDEAFSQLDTADLTNPTGAPVSPMDRYRNRDRFRERERERENDHRRKKDRGVKFLFRLKACPRGLDRDADSF